MRTLLTKTSYSLHLNKIKSLDRRATSCRLRLANYWQHNWYHKCIVAGLAVVLLALGSTYGIGRWYQWSERQQPVTLGVTFIADYARFLGVDPHQTFTALLDDLHVRHFRLVSYWSDLESQRGTYNFTELDWEFQQAADRGATISLAVGLRQPRWPECHMPDWAQQEPASAWEPQLMAAMTAVINRYKHNPALASYQLENEYFLTSFAACADESRSRLAAEAQLVRQLDPHHTLIISRSNNGLGWPIGQPQADVSALSIYHRVWLPQIGRYLEYPFPAWYYAFLAGIEKLWSGQDTIIHELQAEPWPPQSASITAISLREQNKSFTAQRLRQMVQFGKATGMKTMYLWGAEYWYYRRQVLHDSSVWNVARQEFSDHD